MKISAVTKAMLLSGGFLAMGGMLVAQTDTLPRPSLWKVHDMSRPKPMVVQPLEQMLPAPAPAGALVLFDGSDFAHWAGADDQAPKWKLEKGYMEIVPGTGFLHSRESFGDVFLHVEWASPDEPDRRGQDRGNSGIFFMGQYELQVLDSYQADTYADGQAGALYGQAPPRFNVCKPRGEWNAYDIAFRRPRFSAKGGLLSPARITVIHNGILIQDNEEYKGPTSWLKYLPYKAHADKLPITLQEHNCRVRFRNIWAMSLPELVNPEKVSGPAVYALSDQALTKFTGAYARPNTDAPIKVTKNKGHLFADFFYRPGALELIPRSDHEFELKDTDATVTFTMDGKGAVTELIFHIGGEDMPAKKVKN
ncbi:MAG TPA: DUF1080 domain-containing protein [Puia sp.]|nr:DUF1080 domain-containing protein [Puia sp.]